MGFVDAVEELARSIGVTVPREASAPGQAQPQSCARLIRSDADRHALLPRAAQAIAARDRLSQAARPLRRDCGALRHRLCAGRLAKSESRIPELPGSRPAGNRPGHRDRDDEAANVMIASATASCFRSSTSAGRSSASAGACWTRASPNT